MKHLSIAMLLGFMMIGCGTKNKIDISGEVVVKHEISINMDEWREYFYNVCRAQGLSYNEATVCADEKLQEFLKGFSL